jgi:hypothetical protein
MKTILLSTMLAICLIGCQKKDDGGSGEQAAPVPVTPAPIPVQTQPPGGPVVSAPSVFAECVLSQGFDDEEQIAVERQRLDISSGNGLSVKGWNEMYPLFQTLRNMGPLQMQMTTLVGMRTNSDNWGLRNALYWLRIRDMAVFSLQWTYDIHCQVIR